MRCWSKRTYDKIVFYIIDALRYDSAFEVKDEKGFGCMPNMLSIGDSEHTQRYHYMAHGPTTTVQRATAFFTGVIPVFSEVLNSLRGSFVTIDSFFKQLYLKKGQVSFVGDHVMDTMYGKYFTDSVRTPSFNRMDLKKSDIAVEKNYKRMISNPNMDFVMFHSVGLDSAAHLKNSVRHPVVCDKLTELDGKMKDMYEILPEKTLFFVGGDHGMTMRGEHGGYTYDELHSGLLLHSTIGVGKPSQRGYNISQIDTASTFSLLLGLPIPHPNVGTPMRSLFIIDENDITQIHDYLNALNVTSIQIQRYLQGTKTINEQIIGFSQQFIPKIKSIQEKEIAKFNDKDEILKLVNEHEEILHGVEEFFSGTFDTFERTMVYTSFSLVYLSIIGLIFSSYVSKMDFSLYDVAYTLVEIIMFTMYFISSLKMPFFFAVFMAIVVSFSCWFTLKAFVFALLSIYDKMNSSDSLLFKEFILFVISAIELIPIFWFLQSEYEQYIFQKIQWWLQWKFNLDRHCGSLENFIYLQKPISYILIVLSLFGIRRHCKKNIDEKETELTEQKDRSKKQENEIILEIDEEEQNNEQDITKEQNTLELNKRNDIKKRIISIVWYLVATAFDIVSCYIIPFYFLKHSDTILIDHYKQNIDPYAKYKLIRIFVHCIFKLYYITVYQKRSKFCYIVQIIASNATYLSLVVEESYYPCVLYILLFVSLANVEMFTTVVSLTFAVLNPKYIFVILWNDATTFFLWKLKSSASPVVFTSQNLIIFFATVHTYDFTSFHFNAGFIGINHFNLIINGAIVLFEAFVSFYLPTVQSYITNNLKGARVSLIIQMFRCGLLLIIFWRYAYKWHTKAWLFPMAIYFWANAVGNFILYLVLHYFYSEDDHWISLRWKSKKEEKQPIVKQDESKNN